MDNLKKINKYNRKLIINNSMSIIHYPLSIIHYQVNQVFGF